MRGLAILLVVGLALFPAIASTTQVPLFVVRPPDCPIEVVSAWVTYDEDGDVDFDARIRNVSTQNVVGIDATIRTVGPDGGVLSTQTVSQHLGRGISPRRKKNVSFDDIQKTSWRTAKYEIRFDRVWFDAEHSWPEVPKKEAGEPRP